VRNKKILAKRACEVFRGLFFCLSRFFIKIEDKEKVVAII